MSNKSTNGMARTMRLFLLALVAAFLIPVAAASGADKVSNPGTFTAEITGGALAMGSGEDGLAVPIDELPEPPIIKGTVDADGNILVKTDTCQTGTDPNETQPATCGAVFKPLSLDLNGDTVYVFIRPSGSDWTGTIDPDTGEFNLNARLRVQAAGNPAGISLGSSCFVGAAGTGNNLFLNPATSNSIPANGVMPAMDGTPYDPSNGEVTVVNNTVAVPAGSGCGPLGLADSTLNSELGLPSASGNNSLSLIMRFTDNAPLPPAIVRYSADPTDEYVPFTTDFDASNSVAYVNGGVIDSYEWDFGDGSAPEVTTDPTVSHDYTAAGVYTTSLKIVAGDAEVSRSRATVTARSIEVDYTQTPPHFSQSRDADFAFEANEAGATYECQLLKNGTVVDMDDPNSGDPGDWASCDSPLSFTGLDDADWSLKVRATSAQGAVGLPSVWDFRVDNVAPTITINSGPSGKVKYSSASATFSADEDHVNFECRILQDLPPELDEQGDPIVPDPVEFEPCESGDTFSWQPIEGNVTLEVRGTDFAGNDGNTASRTWEVDLTPPVTTVTSGPPSPTNAVGGAYTEACDGTSIFGLCIGTTKETSNVGNAAQSFAFAANEASTYVCQFNDGPERPCESGVQTGLGHSGPNGSFSLNENLLRLGTPVQGTNTLKIWATDSAGNRETDPAIRTFVYDTVPPNLTVFPTSRPAEYTKSVNNTVIFNSDEPVTAFQCRTLNNTGGTTTDFANNVTGYVPCDPGMLSNVLGYQIANGQTEGKKGLQVRATDVTGNTQTTDAQVRSTGVTIYWVVDNTAPVASFGAGSQQEGSFTTNTTATINLAATDTPINFGVSTANTPLQQPSYECSLNGAAFAACATPVSLTGLTPGQQSFRMRVTDKATNVSAIIERKWTVVDGSNASVTLTSKPASVIGHRFPTYEFTPSSGSSECRVDATEAQNNAGTGWVACTSPFTTGSLVDGNHQVEIRANASSVPVVDNFAVYANVPTVSVANLPGISRPDGNRYTGLAEDEAAPTFSSAANPAYAPGATTFECRYYEASDVAGPWEACESPFAVNWDKLADGDEMNLEVRPVSSTGNVGTAVTNSWIIDSTKPEIAKGAGTWAAPVVSTACGRGTTPGPGPGTQLDGTAGTCVTTANSSEPWSTVSITNPQFRAVSSEPINGAIGFACQLNGGIVQNPCTARTGSFPAGGNPLTVITNGSNRGNNDNLGSAAQNGAITQNGANSLKIWAVDKGGNMSDAAVTYNFTHDSVMPGFAIDSPTPARTNKGTAGDPLSIDISSTEDMNPDKGFACRLISGGTASTNATNPGANPNAALGSGWTICPMAKEDPDDPGSDWDLRKASWSADNLAEGNYVLHIRGWDSVWNVQTGTGSGQRPTTTDNSVNGRAYVFTIDRTAPTVNITTGPAEGSTVAPTSGEFAFTPSEAAAQIENTECRLDPVDPDDIDGPEASAWESCSSPYAFEDLTDGAHVFQVRSLDTAGNQGAPTTRHWTIDTTLPVIDLQSDVSGSITNQTSIAFTIDVTPADSSLECRIAASSEDWADPYDHITGLTYSDPAEALDEFVPCASPVSLDGLADGEYTLEVKATNTLGTVGELAEKTWTVDTVAPVATINSGPNSATKNTSASFAFSSDKAGSTFECDLDGDVAACTSPVSYSGLDDGNHTVKVRATDPAGNTSAWVDRSWSIDTVTPVTTIDQGPSGTQNSKSATFEFSSSKAGSTFECQFNGGSWATCSSPKQYSGLSNGLQTVRIRATDSLGNVGAAVERNWAVVVPVCPPGQVGDYPDCAFPTQTLTVSKAGTGQGNVTSSPVGIDCGSDCSEAYTEGNSVTLTATPANGSVFAGWSGACTGTSTTCQVTMSEAKTVTATFNTAPVTTCPTGQIGTPPNCVTPLPPQPTPTDTTGSYDPATGKLAIRLKCGNQFKPTCLSMKAVAVTGKKGKAMSQTITVRQKAGKWKLVTLTIKPAYRQKVAAMTAVNKKMLMVRVDVTYKKKGKKAKKRVFPKYKVRTKG